MLMCGSLRCLTISSYDFFFSSRRRHTRLPCDWSSDVCSSDLIEAGGLIAAPEPEREASSGLIGAPGVEQEESAAKEPSVESPKASPSAAATAAKTADATPAERLPVPLWLWITFAVGIAIIVLIYWLWNWERLEVFKMLLTSFFPLALMILAVLGSIVFGLATPSEAAAVGGFGG